MSDDLYIWVNRWDEFQHYKPNPDRGPAWIKQHTAQLSDDRYLALTDRRRCLLHDVRMLFATFRGRLAYDARKIARYRSGHTRDDDLKALVSAGLLTVLSRESLERRLDKFYSRSRAELEVEVEKEKPFPTPTSTYNGAPAELPDLEHVLKDMPL